MQSAEDRRRLLEQYAERQSSPLAAVLKCAAGIVTLFAVAAGPWVVLSAGGRGGRVEQPAHKAAAAYPNSIGDSRRVFEERLQRSQAREQATRAAAADKPENRYSLQLR